MGLFLFADVVDVILFRPLFLRAAIFIETVLEIELQEFLFPAEKFCIKVSLLRLTLTIHRIRGIYDFACLIHWNLGLCLLLWQMDWIWRYNCHLLLSSSFQQRRCTWCSVFIRRRRVISACFLSKLNKVYRIFTTN